MVSQRRLALMRLALLLLPVAIALAAIIVTEWMLLPNVALPAPKPTPLSARYAISEATAYTPRPLSAFEEIGRRTLFLASRGQVAAQAAPEPPPTEPPASAPSVPSLVPPNGTLVAVMLTPDQELALVQPGPSEPVIRLAPGDDLNGWKLVAIYKDRIELQAGNEVQALFLMDAKPLEGTIGPGATQNAPTSEQPISMPPAPLEFPE